MNPPERLDLLFFDDSSSSDRSIIDCESSSDAGTTEGNALWFNHASSGDVPQFQSMAVTVS